MRPHEKQQKEKKYRKIALTYKTTEQTPTEVIPLFLPQRMELLKGLIPGVLKSTMPEENAEKKR